MGKITFICLLLCVLKHCVTKKLSWAQELVAVVRLEVRGKVLLGLRVLVRVQQERVQREKVLRERVQRRRVLPKRSPSKKRRSTSKKAAAHPAYKDMIKAAIIGLKQRGGSSRQAIAKYIAGHYKVGDNANVHLRMAIKRALSSGMLVTNATHSNTFRLAPEAKKVPKTPKKKKVTAKKPAAKKTAKPKKKTPAKKKSTPKKAKKPATKTKKKTTTKKKPAAKKPAKKSAAKKTKRTPAKKAKK